MADLVVLVPVLNRPHRVVPLLDSLAAATTDPFRVLFICDPWDSEEIGTVCVATADMPTGDLLIFEGNYAAKIRAGVEATTEPHVFTGADDLHFHPGWYEAAKRRLTGDVGVVGVQDRCNRRTLRGEHATHFLMARWYAQSPTIDDAPGPFSQAYDHNFCDDELVATARHRKAWAFAGDSVVEHMHPMIGTAPDDPVYAKGRARFRQDRALFRERSALWT